MIRVALVGYGNIGKYAFKAVNAATDMELAGIVYNNFPVDENLPELAGHKIVATIEELTDVDVAILCIPSRSVPEAALQLLELGINTVDSYDIHGHLADLRKQLQAPAEKNQAVAVVSAGWDPGTDSMIRCMFEFMAPSGITYTNFGPGMSMGHTVAARAISGVKNALSMTIPTGTGMHRRMVYVELEQNQNLSEIEAAIKNDPYFARDETHVIQVADVNDYIDMGHGVLMERKGVSSSTHNQMLKFDMKITNPALTGQIMTAAARASMKQKPGAYTLIQIPIIDFLIGDPDEIIRRLV